jgi:hypothetical protein
VASGPGRGVIPASISATEEAPSGGPGGSASPGKGVPPSEPTTVPASGISSEKGWLQALAAAIDTARQQERAQVETESVAGMVFKSPNPIL